MGNTVAKFLYFIESITDSSAGFFLLLAFIGVIALLVYYIWVEIKQNK